MSEEIITQQPVVEPKKQRGRPKKVKTAEDLEEDRKKKNEYQNKYHKERCERDKEYAENYRLKLNQRTRNYAKRNREKMNMYHNLYQQEIYRKSKLYDEIMKNMSLNK
jgi:hypothetical protein